MKRTIKRKPTQKKTKPEIKSTLTSSGSTLLDLILGGGFPFGKVVNFVGDRSTGKTILASEVIFAARKVYGDKLKWRYNDSERGYTFDSTYLYGFPIIDENKPPSDNIEDFDTDINHELDILEDDEFLIYVQDSLDALSSRAEIERAQERRRLLLTKPDSPKLKTGTYGLEKQKLLGEFFRTTVGKIERKNCLIIIISQVRDNIGATFGKKYVRTGGKALDFYASTILVLAEVQKHEVTCQGTKETIGVTIKAKTDKNKIARPFKTAYIDIVFDIGIDDITANIEYLYDLKTDAGKSRAARIEWDEKTYLPKKLVEHIENNNLECLLKQKVQDKYNSIQNELRSRRKRKWFSEE